MRTRLGTAVFGLLGVITGAPALAIQLNFGDILLADDPSGLGIIGRIIRFNPMTGTSDVVSSGGFLDVVSELTLDNQGRILVACGLATNVVRIDPLNGSQTLVASGFFQEGLGAPLGMTVAPSGNIIIATDAGRIIEVDPNTGSKHVVATLPSGAAGLDRRGEDVFVVSSPLQRFNISSGIVTPVAAGGLLSFPYRIAVDEAGYGYVVDFDSGLMGVDLETGEERFISSGALLLDLSDVAIGANSRPICAISSGQIVEIDPDNFGEQILLTAPGESLGSRIVAMQMVTVVPAPGACSTFLIASGTTACRRRRRAACDRTPRS